MKHILLPEAGEQTKYYRANLHCHSSLSDGEKSPEELKRFYKEHGYSILAITDHDLFIPHNDLTDEDFLMLNGFEFEINEAKKAEFPDIRCCHLCYVALDESMKESICYHRTGYLFANAANHRDKLVYDESKPDYERSYSPECINEMIKIGRDAGFFVTYNHPTWSLESYPEYSAYTGMNAMEIVNFSCRVGGYDDDNGHAYRDMLEKGERIFCIAADDNHNHAPDLSPNCDSFGGYIMVAADKLDYKTVAAALKNGMFYASSGTSAEKGPDIRALTYEDGRVFVKTSPAKQISLLTASRSNRVANAANGEYVTEASFTLRPGETWFRVTVRDEHGHKAYSNAYFVGTLQ